MNFSQPTSGEGNHTLLKRVFLIGATLLVVAGLAFVLVMALAPQTLPAGDARTLPTPPPTLVPIESIVGGDQQLGGFRPAPAPAISYATPVYIEVGNHSACSAQKIDLPFTGSQSANSEFNIYRFRTSTPALRLSIGNYNNMGEVLIYEIMDDTCSTNGKMTVRFVTSTSLKTSSMDADVVNGLAAGADYLLAIHTAGRLNSEIYTLILNEIEAPATTATTQNTPAPAGAALRSKTASATSTSLPSPTPPPLPDAEFVMTITITPAAPSSQSQPSAPSNEPAQPIAQPSSSPTSAPIPIVVAATATTRAPIVATHVIVLPTIEPANTATPQPSATTAPSATSMAPSTPPPTSTSEPISTPRPSNTPQSTNTAVPATATNAPVVQATQTSAPTPQPTNTPIHEPKPTKTPKHPTPEPTVAAPTAAPPTATSAPPTATSSPPTNTPVPPTAEPPTAVPPTAVPPTAEPPTAEPPTAVPPTAVPPTAVPPTAEPPTAEPPPTTQAVIKNTPAL
jgi:hypothetical protein